MKTVKLITFTLCSLMFMSCGTGKKEQTNNQLFKRTAETEKLLSNLAHLPQQGFLFGHHDDTNYGINADGTGWEFEEGRSDVHSVCGDYPGIISFDLGELELGGELTLDKVPFGKIRQEIINQYQRGGMSSISWHLRNPKTDGDAWDVSDTTVVKSILPEGELHEKFAGWLDTMADFLNSLQTPEGVKVPVLFRPWHEHTGSWFWWGKKLCSVDEYKALWRMTVEHLEAKGVDNCLYAYSPGTEPQTEEEYLERYPGDDIIDLIGFDTYQGPHNRDSYLNGIQRMLNIIEKIGKEHNKIIAVTETGFEGVPDPQWWTGTLLPALNNHPIAYALVWRNARERTTHHYAPYPGHPSAEDFVQFYNEPKTLFAKDINLYK